MSKDKKELASVPKGENVVMKEFKPKKQNIDIIYEDGNFIPDAEGSGGQYFDKVLFYKDIKGYQLNGPYLVIQEQDDTQYVYPMSAISSLKLYVTE